jgi:hypothetical protein
MFDSLKDFVSIIPFNKIKKVIYTILSIQNNCTFKEFENIVSKTGLKQYYRRGEGECFYENKKMDENRITVCGSFMNDKIDFIESHFTSYIGTEYINVTKEYFSMYDEIEKYISRMYSMPKVSVNDTLKKVKIPLIDAEIKSLEYRQKLIYSNKYETRWEKENFHLIMEMNPEFQILIWLNGINYTGTNKYKNITYQNVNNENIALENFLHNKQTYKDFINYIQIDNNLEKYLSDIFNSCSTGNNEVKEADIINKYGKKIYPIISSWAISINKNNEISDENRAIIFNCIRNDMEYYRNIYDLLQN